MSGESKLGEFIQANMELEKKIIEFKQLEQEFKRELESSNIKIKSQSAQLEEAKLQIDRLAKRVK
jgi:phosphoribosylaminoimidazole-succinocarboxamide synthase